MRLLTRHGIDVLFDVGANGGQYGSLMRALGFTGKIVSFEPLDDAYAALTRATVGDRNWIAENTALGAAEGMATLNVAGNSQSSSFLPMLPVHVEAAPSSRYIRTQDVPVTTLAAMIDKHLQQGERLFVKLDTQGSESEILRGLDNRLNDVQGFQVEASLVSLYEGEYLVEDTIGLLRSMGFVPMSIEPGFWDPSTSQLLQVDLVFFRPNGGEGEQGGTKIGSTRQSGR